MLPRCSHGRYEEGSDPVVFRMLLQFTGADMASPGGPFGAPGVLDSSLTVPPRLFPAIDVKRPCSGPTSNPGCHAWQTNWLNATCTICHESVQSPAQTLCASAPSPAVSSPSRLHSPVFAKRFQGVLLESKDPSHLHSLDHASRTSGCI